MAGSRLAGLLALLPCINHSCPTAIRVTLYLRRWSILGIYLTTALSSQPFITLRLCSYYYFFSHSCIFPPTIPPLATSHLAEVIYTQKLSDLSCGYFRKSLPLCPFFGAVLFSLLSVSYLVVFLLFLSSHVFHYLDLMFYLFAHVYIPHYFLCFRTECLRLYLFTPHGLLSTVFY